jgi:hypothetical protein
MTNARSGCSGPSATTQTSESPACGRTGGDSADAQPGVDSADAGIGIKKRSRKRNKSCKPLLCLRSCPRSSRAFRPGSRGDQSESKTRTNNFTVVLFTLPGMITSDITWVVTWKLGFVIGRERASAVALVSSIFRPVTPTGSGFGWGYTDARGGRYLCAVAVLRFPLLDWS